MFGIKFIKSDPTNYLIKYVDGKIKKEGSGISFFYFAPVTSIVSIPIGSIDVPFIIKEITSDHQQVTIQGQVIYRITQPLLIVQMMDFTLDSKGKNYVSEDPVNLQSRIINHVQVLVRNEFQKMHLREALKMSDILVERLLPKLRSLKSITSLGLEILDLSILAIKPTPETARALETEIRELLLKEADTAIYDRRNAAVEQERAIKENELNTELAVEQKKKQIREAQMDAELAVQEKERQMQLSDKETKIKLEEENKKLVSLSVENAKTLADSKEYEMTALLKPLTTMDYKVLEVIAQSQMDSSRLIAQAFRDISGNAEKIGELNISPDLLQSLMNKRK